MKRVVNVMAVWVLVLVAQLAMAQSGAITYETKINMHRNMPPERAAMKDMIPEYRTSRNILFFNQNESLYKPLIDEEDDMAAAATGGGGMSFTFKMAQNQTYLHMGQEKRVSLREFMGKNYIIQDTLTILPWKFGDETKTIQGYTCKQAFYTDEKNNRTTVAWYTDQLRPNLGPESFASLPGAVLELNVDNGLRITKATKIDLRNLKKNELVEPTKGEKRSEKEYQAMLQEQMQRSGGNMIIRN